MVIKLETKNKKQKLFSGRPLGEALRSQYNLDKLDKGDDIIYVEISYKVFSIDKEFFYGLFGKSIKKLTPIGFNSKYRVVGNHNITKKIGEWTSQAMFAVS